MKSQSSHGPFKVSGAFQAPARPLFAGAVCRPPKRESGQNTAAAADAVQALVGDGKPALVELAEGPYFVLAILFDVSTLCRMDASCRLLRRLNCVCVGPWRALGARVFHGLELEREGTFEHPAAAPHMVITDDSWFDGACGILACVGGVLGSAGSVLTTGITIGNCATFGRTSAELTRLSRIDWKGRFCRFRNEVPTFCPPFGGSEILAVTQTDEVAYFRCRLCTDVLNEASTHGVYLEVDVLVNPDNLSMAVVDFEAGGCSSVTFSPDTGAVIRERKVREVPRKVEGAYIQPLPTVPAGRRFHGRMGLYLCQGRLAFFRRCVGSGRGSAPAVAPPGAGESSSSGHRGGAAQAFTTFTTSQQQFENIMYTFSSAASSSSGSSVVSSDGESSQELRAATSTADQSKTGPAPAGAVLDEAEMGPWETTGFVSDLAWAEGGRLTPCLAFRDEGAYKVRIVNVGTVPPLPPGRWPTEAQPREVPRATGVGAAAAEGSPDWSGFDWEVGPPGVLDAAGV